ncbi:excalibur calcium-binding domain-containing protein [Blastococcus brunescens]|uniref:Excalibur calcium-binding domain-containing protein n=1 Tax=Blastococcus brunescens TaxID=1564165 RepID=A0ABZ1AZT8_9ACTN|nr:excalibur calcium-binding domain-containing protein [Blastococcus sp. BMG 8361]WRL64072.1 excalibur calcium-binding domain-containing protein [Blastococcus sp. BMG 8361]
MLDPTTLPAFLAELPELVENAGGELATAGEALLTAAGEDLQKCLPAPPTGGGTQTPPPTPPTTTPHPQPVQPAAVHYENCDDARAKGAAPVHAGHPGYGAHLDSDSDGIGCEVDTVAYTHPTYDSTGTLAYTGVATEPLVAWGAALLAAGAWLIASARRTA